jgi:hypothetical protein
MGKSISAIARQNGALPFPRNTVQIVLELKKHMSPQVVEFGVLVSSVELRGLILDFWSRISPDRVR